MRPSTGDGVGWKLVALIGTFLLVDLTFLAANIIKIPHGGWFPLVAAVLVFYVMTTWRTGRRLLSFKLKRARQPMEAMIASLTRSKIPRIEGTGGLSVPDSGQRSAGLPGQPSPQPGGPRVRRVPSVITSDMPRVPRAAGMR